jgi:hypothetical protein
VGKVVDELVIPARRMGKRGAQGPSDIKATLTHVVARQGRNGRVVTVIGYPCTAADGRRPCRRLQGWRVQVELSGRQTGPWRRDWCLGRARGRSGSMGHGGALTRPEASWRASMPVLAGAGRVWARVAWAVWCVSMVLACISGFRVT